MGRQYKYDIKLIMPGIIFFLFLFPLHSVPQKKIEVLLQDKQFTEVENYCAKLKGKKQQQCYRQLGDAYFQEDNYQKAGECYEKCEYIEGYNRVGEAYLGQGNPLKAVEYFEKGTPSAQRALTYEKAADQYKQQNNNAAAKKYYDKAVSQYEFLLKNFYYEWKNEYYTAMKQVIAKQDQMEKTAAEKVEQALLEKILKGSGDYCTKMRNWAFHFFCKEEVSEFRDYKKEVEKGFKAGRYWMPESTDAPVVKNNYLYEYQLLQEKNKVQETRTLLEQNGVKKNEPNAKLQTQGYKYEKLIFGPLALLSKVWQKSFSYKILKEDVLWGEKAVVIEAIPLRYYPKNHLFGKIWISMDDFSVLRIEWNPKSMGFAREVEEKSRLFKAEPEITFFAEFKYKKRGIRFPSRYYLEESYIKKKRKKFIRLKQDVVLKDYMFFVVGTEVTEAKPEIKK